MTFKKPFTDQITRRACGVIIILPEQIPSPIAYCTLSQYCNKSSKFLIHNIIDNLENQDFAENYFQ